GQARANHDHIRVHQAIKPGHSGVFISGAGLGYDRGVPVLHDTGASGPEDARPEGSAFSAARPHIALVYDYLLGGKENFAADRAVAEQILASLPAVQVG